MTDNYVGPGWYWVEGTNQPLFLFSKNGRLTSMLYVENIGVRESTTSCGEPFKIIANIPRPITRPVVDWSVMPAWAKWVAQGYTGWFWFTEKPTAQDDVESYCNTEESGSEFGFIPEEHEPTYTGDWKNSLVGRPE